MELKKGYKRTEVGVIPEDWEVKKIQETSPFQRGFDLPSYQLVAGKYAVVYSNGIGFYHSNFMSKGPGVVTGRSGTLGKIHYINDDFWPHNTALWVTSFFNNNPKYIYYLLSFINIGRFGTGSGVPTLNRNDVHDFQIPLPPLPEQKAIARVLSDTDTLIQTLQKKINKKRAIKQGAMQQLLKPKEGWERKKLGEVVEFMDNLRKPIKSRDREGMKGDYPYYGASGIIDFVNSYLFDDDLILLGEDGENILSRNLPLAFKVSGKIWVNNHAHVLKPRTGYHIDYLTEYLESLDYSLLNSGTAQPKLNKKSCSNILIKSPSFSEQKRIATILSDMDTEIEQLEQKLSKYKSIKQGLMQNLLTGKIRLV